MDSSDDSKKSFLKHVFNFDDDSKSEILNIIQYALLAIIPIVILNKSISKYVPESNDKKGSVEITAEILIQILVMFVGLLIIHRIITYVPTYSGEKYPEFNIIFIILAILMITLSLQTKLGEKIGILVDRLMLLWDGKQENKHAKNTKVKVSQPISGQAMNHAAITQSLYTDGTAINSLPTNEVSYSQSNTVPSQNAPNYDSMYRQDTTPLVGAASPNSTENMGVMEPMAANAVLGGGSFGSSW